MNDIDIVGKYFLLNGIVKNTEEFDADLITKKKTVYEVVRIVNGKPLFFKEHIDRLFNSIFLAHMNMPVSAEELRNQTIKFIKINQIDSGNFKIIITEDGDTAIFKIKHKYPNEADYKNGVDVILYRGERKTPNIKLIDAMFRANVNEKLKEKNAFEAILVDRKGFITEGSRSNIFMLKGDTVITSPISDILPGITRSKIIQISKELGFKVLEKKINCNELDEMDGLFITGTSPEVLPIRKVDDKEFNSQNNEVIMRIMEKYNIFKLADIEKFAI